MENEENRKKIVYISLPITGHEPSYINRLEGAILEVRDKFPGCQIVTPMHMADIVNMMHPHGSGAQDGEYLGKEVEFIIDSATDVYMCLGWENSNGCRVENYVAEMYGKNIIYQ